VLHDKKDRFFSSKHQILDTEIPLSSCATLFLTVTPSAVFSAVASIAFLLLCSALLAASEVAFFGLSPNEIERLRQHEDNVTIKNIVRLIDMPQTLLATLLIANTLINIGIVVVADFVIKDFFENSFFIHFSHSLIERFQWNVSPEWLADAINFLITVVGVTSLLVLFGEITPKLYARGNKLGLAKFMAGTIIFLSKIFSPLSRFLVRWTDRLEETIEERTGGSSNVMSKEDFDKAIELTMSKDNTAKEADILKSIISFGDVPVKRICCPRTSIVALEISTDFEAVVEEVKKSGFSRLPVFEDDLDNIKGILYTKDLIEHLKEPKHFQWQALVETDVIYTPETKKIDDMLRFFQKEKQHMAIVVDEYGGTAGLLTLEDIIEEIIGDIRDEFDDETEIDYKKIDDFNYVFEGKTLLNDAFRVLRIDPTDFEESRGDADSLGGLILERTGIIPRKETEIKINNIAFKVMAVNKRRIEQVKVTLPQA
jgi:putative hemolysin